MAKLFDLLENIMLVGLGFAAGWYLQSNHFQPPIAPQYQQPQQSQGYQ